MRNSTLFYIDGSWVSPAAPNFLDIVNPSIRQPNKRSRNVVWGLLPMLIERSPLSGQRLKIFAFPLLDRIIASYQKRFDEIVEAIVLEMGAPISFSRNVQARAARAWMS